MAVFKVLCVILSTACLSQAAPTLGSIVSEVADRSLGVVDAMGAVNKTVDGIITASEDLRKTMLSMMNVAEDFNAWAKNGEVAKMLDIGRCASDKMIEFEDLAKTLAPLSTETVSLVSKSMQDTKDCLSGTNSLTCLTMKIASVGAAAKDIGSRMLKTGSSAGHLVTGLSRDMSACIQNRKNQESSTAGNKSG